MSNESNQNAEPEKETSEVANASPLARFFFLKTNFGLLFTLLLAAGGVMAYFNLTKESLPDLDIPQATVVTIWPGADPDTIEQQLTQKIEDEINTLKGLKTYSSASFNSMSIIAVEFTAESDSDEAMQRLRDAVSDAESSLPDDAESPEINQVSVDDSPILTFALFGQVSDEVLSELGKLLEDKLETISGVNEVELGGARDEIIQILLDPQRLLALNIPPTRVLNSLISANLDQPFGEIQSEDIGSVMRLEGQFKDLEDIRNLPIVRLGGNFNERPIKLSELGTVQRLLERETSRSFYSEAGTPFAKSIDVSIKKAPGADTVKLIEEIKLELEKIKASESWPDSINYAITQDNAEVIWDSLIGVFINGLQAMAAVFIILFLILTWREGLIAGLSIPVSFAGTMVAIWALGYTLNELVIIGMVLALGLLVDVFILMMEGIHEGIYAQKLTFGQAALSTISRYGMPAFAGQLTTILALAPLMAITGTSGKFIRVLPVTAISCLVIAFAVALLAAVPLSRFLMGKISKSGTQVKETKADLLMGSLSGKLQSFSLKYTLTSRSRAGVLVAAAVGLFVLSLLAASQIPITLYPNSDGVNLGINIELPPSTTLSTSQRVADDVGELLREKPYFKSLIMQVGRKSPMAGGSIGSALQPSESESFIGFSITFVEREERDEMGYVLANDIRRQLAEYLDANVAGASLLVVADTGSPTVGDPIEIVISGSDTSELMRMADEVKTVLASINGTSDVRDNLGAMKTEIALLPDREAADFYGLSQQDLAAQIRFALANDKIAEFTAADSIDDLDIHMGLDWISRAGQGGGPTRLDELSLVRAFTPAGNTVPLLSLLQADVSEAPTSVIHRDGDRAITVLSKIGDRSINEVLADFEPRLMEMSESWPAGYSWRIGGESEETAETFGSAGIMLVVALIMVFGVLVIVFGSFAQAAILMTTMPLALIGTFLGFWIFGMSLSFFAVIGLISLIGIVANNGIVMVDTMNHLLRDDKTDVVQAAAQGAALRLRPILTTSVTTVVGLLPLALGSPMYAPLCYAIIFGLVASTLLSLFIVPCLYLLLTNEEKMGRQVLD